MQTTSADRSSYGCSLVPLAELVIVATGFLGILCLSGAMEVTERVLRQGYSITGALERMRGEIGVERLSRGYVAEEPLLLANSDWNVERESLLRDEAERRELRREAGRVTLAAAHRPDRPAPFPATLGSAISPTFVGASSQPPK